MRPLIYPLHPRRLVSHQALNETLSVPGGVNTLATSDGASEPTWPWECIVGIVPLGGAESSPVDDLLALG
jgi:hypothetical protein